MKLEEMLAKCPECGSTDKIIKRRMIDNHHAHAELKEIVCENCGHVFSDGSEEEPEEIKEKEKVLRELTQNGLF
ncbi:MULTISPECIES: TIGR04165 family Cys-rich peptide [Methanobrevibacter]|jgi:Cys-rich peptide (TIGR04165 family)|uniref:TIGR04165 family Cys-rich peptide n=1 Tax=Methanobrevibacter TaxID=2172 RepID=UPI0037662DBA|nr:TIGR04165 family Cys-rich peptide [Methanobacteriaceae archaeon]